MEDYYKLRKAEQYTREYFRKKYGIFWRFKLIDNIYNDEYLEKMIGFMQSSNNNLIDANNRKLYLVHNTINAFVYLAGVDKIITPSAFSKLSKYHKTNFIDKDCIPNVYGESDGFCVEDEQ